MKHRINTTLTAVVLVILVGVAAASTTARPSAPPVSLGFAVVPHDHEPPSTTTTTTAPATTTTAVPATTEAPTTTAEPTTEATEPETTVTTRARRTTTAAPATEAPVVETTVAETTTTPTVPAPDPGTPDPGNACATGPAFDAHACELIQYVGDFTPEEVQALVARAFPGEESKALSVAACETGRRWHRTARNPGSGARGIMQIIPSWAPRFAEVTGVAYYDGVFQVGANLVFAQWLRHESGWGNWSCH